ncbi:MAG: type 1 secretion target protein, partial [Proteobacteria bacterium]|nr:type 1 secretion target protein [Pseudomonadota bacterium]
PAVTSFTVNGTSYSAGQTAAIAGVGTLTIAANGAYTFTPVANYNGAVPVATYTVSDGVNTDTSTLTISVTSIEDSPTITMPTSLTALEDTGKTISGISVADVDSSNLTTTISVQHGSLSVSAGSGALITGNSTGAVTLVGTAAQINAALAGLSYTGSSNYSGSDTLTVTSSDGSTAVTTKTETIAVTAVADAPTISITTGTSTTHTQLVIGGGTASGGLLITDGVIQAGTDQKVWRTADFATAGGNANGTDATGDIFVYTSDAVVNGANGAGSSATDARDYIVLDKPASAYTVTYSSDHGGAYNGYDNVHITDNATGKTWGVTNNIEDIIFSDGSTLSGLTTVQSVTYDTMALNINAALTDVDGSEVLSSILLTGIPAGVTLSAGTRQADGSWLLSSAQLAGLSMNVPAGTGAFDIAASVTSTESINGDYRTTTTNLHVDAINHAPIVGTSSGTVSEEGLSGGVADTAGTVDTTNSATTTGTVAINDVDADATLTVMLTAPTTTLTSAGQAVSWSGAGTHTLTATRADGEVVATLTIDDTGHYTFNLLKPIDHSGANVEDIKAIDFGVVASDGVTSTTGTLTVNVEDDSSVALTAVTGQLESLDTNIMIVLDVSGSMAETDGVDGATRLASAIAAINTLLDRYDDNGNVMVRLVTFSTTASAVGSVWTNIATAKAQLAALAANGGTNYDEALGDTITAFSSSGKIVGAQNVAYFFSDGLPTYGAGNTSSLTGGTNGTGYDQSGSDTGIQASEETTWTNFLNNNQIKTYAIGMGSGITTTSYLNPVAYDGQASDNSSGVMVTDFAQLDSVLASTVTQMSGDLVAGGLAAGAGADGGYVKSLTIDGVTYTYDPASGGSVTTSGGTSHGVFDTSTDTLTVTTTNGGEFVVDMDDATYRYVEPGNVTSGAHDTMSYVFTDYDGDTQSSSVTVDVTRMTVTTGTTSADTLNGSDTAPDFIMGRGGNDVIHGLGGNDRIYGGDGNDTLYGDAGNDLLHGGAGTDVLSGGDGSDTLIGGAGNDTLTGGLGSDTFVWHLADKGTTTTPAADVITDFDMTLPSAGGDVLNLQDLLQGENHTTGTGNLSNYLHFEQVGSDTLVHISSSGAYSSGFATSKDDQRITLQGVDLTTIGNDVAIIQDLLTKGKLSTD